MKCIFKHPVTNTLQIGEVLKVINVPKSNNRYVVASEKGSILELTNNKDNPGFVDFELSETILPHIETNLTGLNQGNFKDKSFKPYFNKWPY